MRNRSQWNIASYKPGFFKDRYASITVEFIKLLQGLISDEVITQKEFMNYSMLLYTTKKKKIDMLVQKYQNLKKGRYQPVKILKMQTSRNKIIIGMGNGAKTKSRSKRDSKNSSLSSTKKTKRMSQNTSISIKTYNQVSESLDGRVFIILCELRSVSCLKLI